MLGNNEFRNAEKIEHMNIYSVCKYSPIVVVLVTVGKYKAGM